jgi:hypothetical protein
LILILIFANLANLVLVLEPGIELELDRAVLEPGIELELDVAVVWARLGSEAGRSVFGIIEYERFLPSLKSSSSSEEIAAYTFLNMTT